MDLDLKRAVEFGEKVLAGCLKASTKLQDIKSSTLFGVTGGLPGLCLIAILHGLTPLPLWPALPLTFALGITLGHIRFRSLRGFRAEARAEEDRAYFDERVRRLKVLKGTIPPQVLNAAWEKLIDETLKSNPALAHLSITSQPADRP